MAMSQQHTPPVNKYTGSYTEHADGDGVRMKAFGHEDADVAFDPLSANRRFPGTADLAPPCWVRWCLRDRLESRST